MEIKLVNRKAKKILDAYNLNKKDLKNLIYKFHNSHYDYDVCISEYEEFIVLVHSLKFESFKNLIKVIRMKENIKIKNRVKLIEFFYNADKNLRDFYNYSTLSGIMFFNLQSFNDIYRFIYDDLNEELY